MPTLKEDLLECGVSDKYYLAGSTVYQPTDIYYGTNHNTGVKEFLVHVRRFTQEGESLPSRDYSLVGCLTDNRADDFKVSK